MYWGDELAEKMKQRSGSSMFKCPFQGSTPSVLNYNSFQESWRVKPSQSLTKIIERNTKIYNIKQVYYENIGNKESNDT